MQLQEYKMKDYIIVVENHFIGEKNKKDIMKEYILEIKNSDKKLLNI